MADEVAFKIIPMFKVGVLQPATVSIYEYYNREYQKIVLQIFYTHA